MMGRFDARALDNDALFQTLIREIAPENVTVAADFDVGSYAETPFITHHSLAQQDRNALGLWTVTLTVGVFAEPLEVNDLAAITYSGIWGWDDPTKAIVPTVGAVESVDEELSAFSRVGGEAQMENKVVIQLSGSWTLTVRNI